MSPFDEVHMTSYLTLIENVCLILQRYFRGVKLYNVSHDPDHATFRDDLSLAGWDFLPLTY